MCFQQRVDNMQTNIQCIVRDEVATLKTDPPRTSSITGENTPIWDPPLYIAVTSQSFMLLKKKHS